MGHISRLYVFSTNASVYSLLQRCAELRWLIMTPSCLAPADPFILPHVRIDRGAIRFLLAGAHMMCPGLTSADAALPAGTPVVFEAEGKDSAVGIGLTKLGTEEMKKVNKGVAVESITYVGDDLWAIQKLG
jgi:predicted RNA-binding protein (TIGR00451 family)